MERKRDLKEKKTYFYTLARAPQQPRPTSPSFYQDIDISQDSVELFKSKYTAPRVVVYLLRSEAVRGLLAFRGLSEFWYVNQGYFKGDWEHFTGKAQIHDK